MLSPQASSAHAQPIV